MNCRKIAFSALIATATVFAAADAIVISINDKVMPMQSGFDPIVSNGHVLVPLRSVFEQLAATVTWHEKTKDIVIEKDKDSVQLFMADGTADKGSGRVKLESPPRIYKGKVYIPLRFVSEAIGAEVGWDAIGKRVTIKTFQDTADPKPPK